MLPEMDAVQRAHVPSALRMSRRAVRPLGVYFSPSFMSWALMVCVATSPSRTTTRGGTSDVLLLTSSVIS